MIQQFNNAKRELIPMSYQNNPSSMATRTYFESNWSIRIKCTATLPAFNPRTL